MDRAGTAARRRCCPAPITRLFLWVLCEIAIIACDFADVRWPPWLQLPFAICPLVRLTNSRALMGTFANRPVMMIVAWSLTGLLAVLNAVLLLQSV